MCKLPDASTATTTTVAYLKASLPLGHDSCMNIPPHILFPERGQKQATQRLDVCGTCIGWLPVPHLVWGGHLFPNANAISGVSGVRPVKFQTPLSSRESSSAMLSLAEWASITTSGRHMNPLVRLQLPTSSISSKAVFLYSLECADDLEKITWGSKKWALSIPSKHCCVFAACGLGRQMLNTKKDVAVSRSWELAVVHCCRSDC